MNYGKQRTLRNKKALSRDSQSFARFVRAADLRSELWAPSMGPYPFRADSRDPPGYIQGIE